MKAKPIEFRELVIEFVNAGGSKYEAARKYKIGRETVYRWIRLARGGKLEPKKSWGTWRKLDPQKLREFIKDHADSTLAEMKKEFCVSHNTIWLRLNKLGITLKKTHKISRAR